jgi:hypothetical protein
VKKTLRWAALPACDVNEPTKEESIQILTGLRDKYGLIKLKITDEAISLLWIVLKVIKTAVFARQGH